MSLEWNSSASSDETSNQVSLQLHPSMIKKAERKAGAYNYSKERVLEKAIAEGIERVI